MTAGPVGFTALDERGHPPGGADWSEVWSFDVVEARSAVGFHLTVERRPAKGRASVRSAVLGADRATVSLVDEDLPLPRGPGLELRGPGIWAAPECETPFDHWSLGLEAFAVRLEDPWEALGAARGERTPLGADLEWETAGPVVALSGPGRGYEVPCRAHGEVMVGAERLAVDGWGTRAHRWGPVPTGGWSRVRLPGWDGGQSVRVGIDDGGRRRAVRADDLRSGRVAVGDGRTGVVLDVLAVAPCPVRGAALVRSLVREARGTATGWLLVGDDSLAST